MVRIATRGARAGAGRPDGCRQDRAGAGAGRPTAASRWSRPTRARSIAGWTSARPSRRSTSVGASRTTCIDVVDPDQTYSLAVYQRQALAAIERIRARGRVPLLVGGAGLYVSAVCDGLAMPDVPPDVDLSRGAGGARARTKAGRRCSASWQRSIPRARARIDPQQRPPRDPRPGGSPRHRPPVFGLADARPRARPVESVLVGLRLERADAVSRASTRASTPGSTGGFVDEVRGLLARGYAPGCRR